VGEAIHCCRRKMNNKFIYYNKKCEERMEATTKQPKTWNRYGENTGRGVGGYHRDQRRSTPFFSQEEEEYFFQEREVFWQRRALEQQGNNNNPPPEQQQQQQQKWCPPAPIIRESRSYYSQKLPRSSAQYVPSRQQTSENKNNYIRRERQFYQTGETSMELHYSQSAERFVPVFLPLRIRNNDLAEVRSILFQTNWKWHEKTFGGGRKAAALTTGGGGGGDGFENEEEEEEDIGLMNFKKFEHLLPKPLCSTLIAYIFPATRNYNELQEIKIRKRRR
jgi:hypothetical protein